MLNLETSITRSGDFAPGKAVHYRMNPDNLGCLLAARPDVCVLANNHVLDFGRRRTARDARRAGRRPGSRSPVPAGTSREAQAPGRGRRAEGAPGGRGRCVAAPEQRGAALRGRPARRRPAWPCCPDLSRRDGRERSAARVRRGEAAGRRSWSSRCTGARTGGTASARDQVRFAHRLVDAGVDVVHGHSSHHPRPLEVYAGRLILYGCGDFVNDYEGIGGHEEYRGELRLLHEVSLAPDGALVSARAGAVPVASPPTGARRSRRRAVAGGRAGPEEPVARRERASYARGPAGAGVDVTARDGGPSRAGHDGPK